MGALQGGIMGASMGFASSFVCFVAGTQVVVGLKVEQEDGNMATLSARELAAERDGAAVATQLKIVGYVTANIEDLNEGDWVISRDQNDPDGPLVAGRIAKKFRRVADHLEIVGIQDAGGCEQTLQTTDEHPFYVPGRSWTKSRLLESGDPLAGPTEPGSAITSNARHSHPQGVVVYNMEIEGTHTYFVRAERSEAEPVWVHNACAAYAKGSSGTNSTVDAVTAEIEAATTQAEAVLRAGGTGGTRWGRIYQRYAGTGTWRESIAYGNAVQQVADGIIRGNPVSSGLISTGQLILNRGSVLGLRNSSGNLLRPDYQLLLEGGNVATVDTSTVGMAGKIWKYDSRQAPYLINISY